MAAGGLNKIVFHSVTSAGVLTANVYTITGIEALTKKGHPNKKNVVITINDVKNDEATTTFINTYLAAQASGSSMETVTFDDGTTSASTATDTAKLVGVFYFTQDSGKIKTYVGACELTDNTGDETTGGNKYTRISKEIKFVDWNGSAAITLTKGTHFDGTIVDTSTGTGFPTGITIGQNVQECWITKKTS